MKLYPLLSSLSLIILFSYNFCILVDALKEEQPNPFKTFKTEHGDIIDCIDILKQPAFNHPLLKDQKIQKNPSHYPDGWIKPVSGQDGISKEVENLGFGEEQQCPEGTIPILRNINEEHDNDSPTIQELSTGEPLPGQNQNDNFFAVMQIKQGTRFLGAQAWIDTPNPKCKDGESSAAFIWLSDGADQKITVGWTVNPRLYGDDRTRLSTYWSGGVDKGCYDLRCPGFVQVDNRVTLGNVLPQVSIPGGEHYGIQVNIYQDQNSKNWWLVYTEDNISIGYWPNELFSQLGNGASRLDFGGRVTSTPSPSMGSGVFPRPGYSADVISYFKLIEYIDSNNATKSPNVEDTNKFLNCPKLFGLDFQLSNDPGVGANFVYGGPGGNCLI